MYEHWEVLTDVATPLMVAVAKVLVQLKLGSTVQLSVHPSFATPIAASHYKSKANVSPQVSTHTFLSTEYNIEVQLSQPFHHVQERQFVGQI